MSATYLSTTPQIQKLTAFIPASQVLTIGLKYYQADQYQGPKFSTLRQCLQFAPFQFAAYGLNKYALRFALGYRLLFVECTNKNVGPLGLIHYRRINQY